MGPFGRGAVGKPSSSTSGRPWASMSPEDLSFGVPESFRRDNWDRLWRRIGGGTASSSLSGSSGGVAIIPFSDEGLSECRRQKAKKLRTVQ
jgi:hypothetical protein